MVTKARWFHAIVIERSFSSRFEFSILPLGRKLYDGYMNEE